MSFDSDQARNERILYLNQLAENPDIDIYDLGDRLALPKEKTMTFLRTFFKTVAEFTNHDDKLEPSSYGEIRNIMNEGVNVEFGGLTDKAVTNLFYVYEKYKESQPDLYIEANGIKATKTFKPRVKVAHASSPIPGSDPNVPDVSSFHPELGPQPGGVSIPTKGDSFNVERLNKGFSYDFLASLKRIGLVRWALEGLPYPPAQSKIESYAQYFEINQDEIFLSPDSLRTSLMKWFGDKTGDHAASIIYSYVRFLPQQEGFGVQKISGQLREGYFAGNDPMYQSPRDGYHPGFGGAVPRSSPFGGSKAPGPRFQDEYNTYYHAEFVLPYGMSAYSEDARRLIHEYERKRKEKQENKEKMDEIMDAARNRMSMAWGEMFEQKKAGQLGGGGSMFGPEFMQSMIMMSMLAAVSSGKMVASPYTDESGRVQVKLEQSQGGTDGTPADGTVPTFRDSLDLVKGMYETIDKKREDATNFKLDWIKEQMNKDKEKEAQSPIQQIGETLKAIKEVFPQFNMGGGGGENAIEIAKLGLERDKFNYDRERTDTLIDHKWEAEQERIKMEHEDAIIANKTRNQTIKQVGAMLTNNLPMFLNLLIMFLSMRNPQLATAASALGAANRPAGGGGLGGLTDMIGGLLKGISGGAADDEDEDEDEPRRKSKGATPFTSIFGKDEDEEEEEGNDASGGGFDMSAIMGGVTDLLKNMGIAQPQQEQQRQQQSKRSARAAYNPQPRGVRPTFRDVEIGNTQASVIMPAPGAEANNAYEEVEMATAKRIKTTPTISEAPAQVELAPFNNAYEETEGVIIPNPQAEVIEQVEEQEEEEEEPPEEDEGEEVVEEEYQEYKPEHFEGKTPAELMELKRRGIASMNSTDSYLRSIDEQLKRKSV